MKTPRLSHAFAVAATAAVLLSGCGGSDSDSSSDASSDATASASADAGSSTETSAEPASGEEVSTDDFSFTAPEGWEDATGKTAGISPEVQYVDADPEGFATNVNVIREPSGFEGSSEEYLEANITGLKNAGYDPIEKKGTFGDFQVLSAAGSMNDTSFVVRQYFAARDGDGWVVTFTFPEGTPEADQVELGESVMQTWAWA